MLVPILILLEMFGLNVPRPFVLAPARRHAKIPAEARCRAVAFTGRSTEVPAAPRKVVIL